MIKEMKKSKIMKDSEMKVKQINVNIEKLKIFGLSNQVKSLIAAQASQFVRIYQKSNKFYALINSILMEDKRLIFYNNILTILYFTIKENLI